jgi:rsbT co-antagonist protein RsbR
MRPVSRKEEFSVIEDLTPSLSDQADADSLRRRVAELEVRLHEREQAEAALQDTIWMLQSVIDGLPYAIYWKDRDLIYRGCNLPFARDLGLESPQAIVGKRDADLPWQPGEAERFNAVDRRVIEHDAPESDSDETAIYPDGSQEWFETHKIPLHDRAGAVAGILATYINITERKLAQRTVQAQTALLTELSTPVIPLSDDVLVMPLIGAIDSRRAQQVMEALLEGVAASQARFAILDITGVPVVDTQVANTLVRVAQAVALLGARVVLTGIRPEVAQTIVGLGVDLRGVVTHSTLQSGIAYALRGR